MTKPTTLWFITDCDENELSPMEEEMRTLESQNRWLKAQLDAVRARCAYPKFCKHPARCANKGTCQAEWVCND